MRVKALDAIRGFAAVMVLLHHNIGSAPVPLRDAIVSWLRFTPLTLAATGRSRVILFFVLSGFSLTMSLASKHTTLGGYVVKRAARIYLPFLTVILLTAGFCALLGDRPTHSGSGWLSLIWNRPVTWPLVGATLTMLGRQQEMALNPVIWTLWYEVRLSLMLPLLIWLASTIGSARLAIATFLLAVAVEIGIRRAGLWTEPTFANSLPSAILVTLHFLPLFVVGLLIARHAEAIVAAVARLPRLAVIGLWAIAGFCLMRFADVYTSVGAMLIVALTIASPRVRKWLENRPCLWLGRISFSLYLVHVPVICVVYRLVPALSWPAKTALTLPISLLLAELGSRYVERPSQHLGRSLASRISRRRGATPVVVEAG